MARQPEVAGQIQTALLIVAAMLEGATDFLEVPQLHTFLMDDEAVQTAVVSFMESAKF